MWWAVVGARVLAGAGLTSTTRQERLYGRFVSWVQILYFIVLAVIVSFSLHKRDLVRFCRRVMPKTLVPVQRQLANSVRKMEAESCVFFCKTCVPAGG